MLNVITGLLGEGTPPVTNSYESISTVTVGAGGAASIDFTSIPATYKHLQVRVLDRGAAANPEANLYARVNSDTGSNYSWHFLWGNGSSTGSSAGASAAYVYGQRFPDNNATANVFGGVVYDFLDYANTSKYKTIRWLGGFDSNGSGQIGLGSGLWMNTNAITSISLYSNNGNLAQYSSFALYGIRG